MGGIHIQTILMIFLIAALGYLLGSISVKGVQLGTSVVLIVALVFGHFGVEIPAIVKNLGLTLFVGSVGLIAGPVFFSNLRKKALQYVVLGTFIIAVGALTTTLLSKLLGTPGPLAVGIMNGALTSTPGLAAALDVVNDPMLSVGYGVAYPFGVLGVVLFVQLLPKILRRDLVEEARQFSETLRGGRGDEGEKPLRVLEPSGLLIFSIVMVLGTLLGAVTIPLPRGGSFSLGTTGGPLFMGIIVGHFKRAGNVSIQVPGKTLSILREFGLMLFLVGAGTDAGAGFVAIVREYGFSLFVQGAIITLVPMVLSCILALKLMKMDLVHTLGAICGGMTSTPALGTLVSTAKTEDVSISYAATYPIALILVVFASQILIHVL